MQHLRTLEGVKVNKSWLTVGTYDGIHLGHQEIIRCVIEGAKKAAIPSVVVTFFPPPAVILSKRQEPYYLTSPEERAVVLERLGVDIMVTHPFNLQVSQMSAHEFVARIHGHFGFRHLCVGHDFALGKNREGDAAQLREIGKEFGFTVSTIPAMEIDGNIVSSSLIRNMLSQGKVAEIERYLGRRYQITGKVIPGDHRGKQLGFPTANMHTWAERALPKTGVYACRVSIKDESWMAVTNIGRRPTFENAPVNPRVEAHLLNFSGDLYGQEVEIEFVSRLRDERKFANVDELIAQVNQDIKVARKFLIKNHQSMKIKDE
ncbi:MAG: bifunctional riboflavin kinase/FAD synthetase [Anaerolineales bacterium]|nr:bifunctional riboflavin kinase/FAD synthetase [Anaerolineales bacterium]